MSSRSYLADLRSGAPVIAPSLLLCDFGHLADEVARLEAAGAQLLHLDVMDGHFVPNLTYGMPLVAAVRRLTRLPIEAHLMISEPGRYLEQFRAAGADVITFHVEAVADPRPLLEQIRSLGAIAGLALNPATPVSAISSSLALCDLVLVMSVMPGFGGQKFDPAAVGKLQQLRGQASAELLLSVDGGINEESIVPCAAAGAQIYVAGSAIFGQSDYARSVARLSELAKSQGRTHNQPWSRSY